MRRKTEDWSESWWLCSEKCLIKTKRRPTLEDQISLDPDWRGPNTHITKMEDRGKNALIAGRKEETDAQNDRIRLAGLKLYTNEPPGAHGHRKGRG